MTPAEDLVRMRSMWRFSAQQTPYEEYVRQGTRQTAAGLLVARPDSLTFVSPSRISYLLQLALILSGTL